MAVHETVYYPTPNRTYDYLISPKNVEYIHKAVHQRLESSGLFAPDELQAVNTRENVVTVMMQQFNHYYDRMVSINFLNDIVIDTISQYLYCEKIERLKNANQNARDTLSFDGRYGMYQCVQPKINKRRPDPICVDIY
jgi:hypothetical protein